MTVVLFSYFDQGKEGGGSTKLFPDDNSASIAINSRIGEMNYRNKQTKTAETLFP